MTKTRSMYRVLQILSILTLIRIAYTDCTIVFDSAQLVMLLIFIAAVFKATLAISLLAYTRTLTERCELYNTFMSLSKFRWFYDLSNDGLLFDTLKCMTCMLAVVIVSKLIDFVSVYSILY